MNQNRSRCSQAARDCLFDPDLEDDLSTAGTVSDPLLAKKTPLSPRKPEHGEKMPWTLLEAMSIMMDT